MHRKTTTARSRADEVALFSKPIRDFMEKVTALAHSAADPSAYATQLLARLCPSVLPYELDTPASFSFAAFNGRGLCDDGDETGDSHAGHEHGPRRWGGARYAADAPGIFPISASRTLRRGEFREGGERTDDTAFRDVDHIDRQVRQLGA